MIRFQLVVPARNPLDTRTQTVIVSLASDHPDAFATIEYEGDEVAVSRVRERLLESRGLYLPIDPDTTPADLAVAMRSAWMKEFTPELIEGKEILAKPRTPRSPGDVH
jgi:hypothetical protein